MYRLFTILLLLNPLRPGVFRRSLGLFGIMIAAVAATFPGVMPDWVVSLVEKASGSAVQTADKREIQRPSGSGSAPTRGELFAAFADLRLRPAQVRRLPDSPAPLAAPPAPVRWLRIDRVLDGDTLAIGGETVRLIGIDAPESGKNDHLSRELNRIGTPGSARDMAWLGREATLYVKRIEGRLCWLEYDRETQDRFGRTLAYVHLDNGVTLNEAILYQGYAKAYLGANFRYMKRYIRLQGEAMTRRNGLWGVR
jgi:micrococcal nuclease